MGGGARIVTASPPLHAVVVFRRRLNNFDDSNSLSESVAARTGVKKTGLAWLHGEFLLFEFATSRILGHSLCLNVLKRRNENDAKGETTIDRAGNTNGRLRPEH